MDGELSGRSGNEAFAHRGERVAVCHECDLLQYAGAVPRRGSLRCARCGALLQRWAAKNLDLPVAAGLAAAVLFLVANIFPVMILEFHGARIEATMLTAAWQLHIQGHTLVGVLVFLTTVVAPSLLLGALLWLLLPLRMGWRAPGFVPMFRALMFVAPWVMVEVLMLSMVVTLVKLAHSVTTTAGVGMWIYAAIMMLMTLVSASMQGEVIWSFYARVMGLNVGLDMGPEPDTKIGTAVRA